MRFKVGDRVVGCTGQVLEPWGTYAELVSARADRLTHIPAGVTFEQAAALPLAGMTAWQALAPSMPLSGKRVLILGGAGGVGHFAVQVRNVYSSVTGTPASVTASLAFLPLSRRFCGALLLLPWCSVHPSDREVPGRLRGSDVQQPQYRVRYTGAGSGQSHRLHQGELARGSGTAV
ncbi:hypothetical protein Vretimale_17264 [Volvox reticuliferus]|uniref:Enoyl reductase (ER) domain-containing protein n=1 Tax=Volvox reticuliferus TaxID=1737510 RepID=A0A8J4LY48_9CHLO|nr:hypothetical protein Vretimale_17264 [Volvox reticuliferus]